MNRRIFVYEHLMASMAPEEGPASWHAEGRAMLTRIVADLAAIDGVCVTTLLHPRQDSKGLASAQITRADRESRDMVMTLARLADVSLVIAPEPEGTLATICRWVVEAGGRLAGPGLASVRLFADKLATAEILGALAIPTLAVEKQAPVAEGPSARQLGGGDRIVVKPRDGAGALSTLVGPPDQQNAMIRRIRADGYRGELIAQPFVGGLPASIAVVGRPNDSSVWLPAVEQLLAYDEIDGLPGVHSLCYAGGRLPLTADLNERAQRLAHRALARCPPIHGYVGIDLILGAAEDGADDRVVEINPRLTTSYVAYSHFFGKDLGRLLLDEPVDPSQFSMEQAELRTPWRFFPDGSIAMDGSIN